MPTFLPGPGPLVLNPYEPFDAPPADYIDADTVLVDIQASGVDVHTFAQVARFIPRPMLIPSVPVQDRSRW